MSAPHNANGAAGAAPEGIPPDVPTISLKRRSVTAPLPAVIGPAPPYGVGPLLPQPPLLPPPVDPTPQRFLSRHRWRLAGAACAVVTAVVVAILALFGGRSADEELAEALVTSSVQEIARVTATASQATTLTAFQVTGSDAQGALTSLGDANARAVNVGSDELRLPLTQFLQAEAVVLQGFARLSEIARKRSRMGAWEDQIRQQIATARAQIGTTLPVLQNLQVVRAGTIDPTIEIDRAVTHIDSVVARLR